MALEMTKSDADYVSLMDGFGSLTQQYSQESTTNGNDNNASNIKGKSRQHRKILLQLPELQRLKYELINIYITDALNTRPPNIVLQQESFKFKICCKIITIKQSVSLWAYKMSHNSIWSKIVYLVIWCHLGLIRWEPYANDENAKYGVGLFFVEILFLLVYIIDVFLHYISHDSINYANKAWVKITLICIGLNIIDEFVIMFLRYIIEIPAKNLWRFGGIIRPVYLICKSQFLRSTTMSIFRVVPRVLDVLILISLFIVMFGVLGFVLFSENQLQIGWYVTNNNATCGNPGDPYYFVDNDCDAAKSRGNPNFDTLMNSILSLCVLMSTANFPGISTIYCNIINSM